MPSDTPEETSIETNEQVTGNALAVSDGLACNGCRRSKLRCSRHRPNCLHCRKTGLECLYETKRVKPGLKPGAVENLHRRLDNLERRVNDQPILHCHIAAARDYESVPGSSNTAAQDILTLLARELPKLITASENQELTTPASSERSNKRRRTNDDHVETSLFTFDDTPSLPHLQATEDIVNAYFHHVHPWIPMIHRGRFDQRFRHERGHKNLHIIVHAMIIAAAKFVPGVSPPIETGLRARKWVVATAMDSLSLESLQALIILAFDDLGSGNAAKTWAIIGSLTRTVEYMQLAQELEDNEHRPLCQPYASLPQTSDWTEIEERRRVFWNVFLLDRFCSVTMGWNTSLTSDDVYRRLPCDGYLWRKQSSVSTPYFGIWDKSKGRMGNPIGYVSRYPSPTRSASDAELHNQAGTVVAISTATYQTTDMSTVGAFAYNIEATESMSRVMSYFLQQKINIRDQNEISSWLTRFKELDLRLVHWKMLLPQKWKANPNLTRQVPLMDPNLTTAHVTHNASMILLHQLIAYPPPHWGFRNRLPSSCSADACYSAGIEIATITEKYLSKSPIGSPIGSQYAFCLFIAGKMLLTHWRYTLGTLPSEFWSLVQSLENISQRWIAFSGNQQAHLNLSMKYALRLKQLYEIYAADETYRIDVMDYTNEISHHIGGVGSTDAHSWPGHTQATPFQAMNMSLPILPDSTEFSAIPQIMLDQNFIDLDRVISFDDGSMFATAFDPGSAAW